MAVGGDSVTVAMYQVQWEFDQLLALVGTPERVLEVGCYEGGTLKHWIERADKVVAVDDVCRNVVEWIGWANGTCDLTWFCGDSTSEAVVSDVERHGPYDLVFIDADHSLDAVRADVDNYGTMIAPGGMLVLHDILPRPGYGVSEVWAELKATDGVRYVEIAKNATEPGNDGPCGIGVLWV